MAVIRRYGPDLQANRACQVERFFRMKVSLAKIVASGMVCATMLTATTAFAAHARHARHHRSRHRTHMASKMGGKMGSSHMSSKMGGKMGASHMSSGGKMGGKMSGGKMGKM
jgi:hypothetical protein